MTPSRTTAGAGVGLALAVLAASFLLRAPITAVPPTLSGIRESLELSASAAGATTSLPLVCFGVFAFLTPFLVARLGLERTMFVLLVPLLVGTLVRSAGSVGPFFIGAVLIGCGIAVGNVLVPAIIRARFPTRVALLMGWYTAMLQISGAAGSVLTVPLEEGTGWGWEPAVGIWAVPIALVLLWWLLVLRRTPSHDTAAVTPPTGLGKVAARPLNWAITAFMGLQSLMFYSLLTWLPAQLTAAGLTASTAGLLLGLFSLLGLPGAFIGPRFATGPHARSFVVVVFGVQILSLFLIGTGPVGAVVTAVVCGLVQGAGLSLALTFIADQPDHRDVPALSALAQGIGYLIAAAGPVLLGLIYAATGGWEVANLVLVAAVGSLIVLGSIIGPRLHRAHAAGRQDARP